MAYEVHEETILYDVKDYLDGNLETYLSGIRSEKTDGLDLPDVALYQVGDFDPYKLVAYPGALLFPMNMEIEALATTQDLLRMETHILVVIQSGVTANLPIKALRYAAALRQCVNADKTCGGAVDRAKITGVIFYQRVPEQPTKMVIESILEVEKAITI